MAASDKDILALFDKWNTAIKTEDPDEVVKLYAADAILIPTQSPDVRETQAERRAYFVKFLKNKPDGSLKEPHVRILGDLAINSGLYTFYMGLTGEPVEARYTFVYTKRDGDWIIIEHHSSMLPAEHAKISRSALNAF